MGTSIDLRKAHHHQVYSDLLAVFSWINDERALFLIPRFRRNAPWFVVMEPAAHTWSDQGDGTNIRLVITKGQKACEVLGIEGNPTNVRRIVGIVNDAIPELVRMPSAPPKDKLAPVFGSMQFRADGKTFAADDIRLDDEGVEYA